MFCVCELKNICLYTFFNVTFLIAHAESVSVHKETITDLGIGEEDAKSYL
jgi:hypothetical protein